MRTTPKTRSAARANLSRRNFLKLSVAVAGAATLRGPAILNAAPKSDKIRLALIGCGGQGKSDMGNMLGYGADLYALCDVDEKMIETARKHAGKAGPGAKAYGDYRKLLDDADKFDAVIVATPDHWHSRIATACMKAGKHVFCEKPLTHSLGEARALRELAKASKVVTQMGNQGSATASVRRSVEVIKAGALGQVHDVYVWLSAGGFPHGVKRPAGSDPIPATFNWDYWVGPSPSRPYKAGVYHPWNWRGWYDFGSGQMGDWGCHAMNMAFRALDLTYAEKIELLSKDGGQENNAPSNEVRHHFPARNGLDAVRLTWGDGGPRPSAEILKDVTARFTPKGKPAKTPDGCLIVGEKGIIYSDGHNFDAMIKLNDEPELKDITRHPATKDIPQTEGRVRSHYDEFMDACMGKGKTYSDFERGGHLTEIALAGVLAVRLNKGFDWDGENLKVKGDPDADKFIHTPARPEYDL
jgi:predicted dehydrogenase